MDKELIAKRFSKAKDTYTDTAYIQHHIAEKMIRLLLTHTSSRSFQHIVEFGCGTGIYSRILQQEFHSKTLLLNDLCPAMEDYLQVPLQTAQQSSVQFIAGDAEHLNFPKGTNLITSCSTLQWFDDPQAFFIRCQRFLETNGYLAFSTFGKKNLQEIKQLIGKGLSYYSIEQLHEMLAPYFEVIHCEEELQSLTFDSPIQVLYHLKYTGVTGTEHCTWTRSRLQSFSNEYTRAYSQPDDKVRLTYHPEYFICRKRNQ